MEMPTVLRAAYGRKYKSATDMIVDFNQGKDFKLLYGPYCSVRDFEGQNVSLMLEPGIYISGRVKYQVFSGFGK